LCARIACTFTLDSVLYDRVRQMVGQINDAATPAIMRGLPSLDDMDLTAIDYKNLKDLVPGAGALEGRDLIAYAITHPAIGRVAHRTVRDAQRLNRKAKHAAQRALAPINLSRTVEALIAKGLETIENGAVEPGPSTRGNVRKAAR
jgi:hypothetical protein